MTPTIDLLDRLVAFDTVSAKSNLSAINFIEDFLRQRGFTVTRIDDPDQPKAGLFARIGPGEGGVLLSAHTDVVPVEGQNWTRDPFRLSHSEGRLFGRGTTDMKGYLAAMLRVADTAQSRNLTEPLKLSISYDEEIGCLGIARMIGALEGTIGKPRCAFIGEPTEMKVATGHKGKAGFRATFTGQAGHSALAPNFLNAIHPAADFVAALRALQDRFAASGARDEAYSIPYTTFHVGKFAAGRALNIVPDAADVTYEFRHLPADRPEDLVEQINGLAQNIVAASGGRTSYQIENLISYPGLETEIDQDVVEFAKRTCGNGETTKVAFGTEAGFFSDMGVPSVVCGPGSMEGQGHKPDEYIEAAQLAACDRMMDAILDEISV